MLFNRVAGDKAESCCGASPDLATLVEAPARRRAGDVGLQDVDGAAGDVPTPGIAQPPFGGMFLGYESVKGGIASARCVGHDAGPSSR